MEYIDEYFKKRNKDISFIEIKEDSQILIKGNSLKTEISLPLMTKDILEKIHTKNIDEIEIKYIIDGIIYTLGIDDSFIHNEEYKDILKKYDENIVEYILYTAIKLLEEEDYIKSGIYSRALLSIENDNIKGLFNYSLVLEKLGIGFMEKEDTKKAEKFISSASDILNKILKIDDSFELAYYKLGFHYKNLQNFLKASLIWKKFLQMSNNDILLQEVREELIIIEDDTNLETGITYLNFMDFDKALESFLKLIPKYQENWNVNYLIAQSYNGLNEFDQAIIYMSFALELNKEEIDIYNSLGSMYINNGDIKRAIEIFSMGIDMFKEDYSLYFNRGACYMGMEDYKKAIIDMDQAYNLNPGDDNVISALKELDNIISQG